MKRYLLIVLGLLFAESCFAQVTLYDRTKYVWTGSGTQLTATTTPQLYILPNSKYAYSVSLVNLGTNNVYYDYSTTTNTFVLSTSSILPPDCSYSSDSSLNVMLDRRLTTIVYATTNATSSFFINFE